MPTVHYQDERRQLASSRLMEMLHEFFAIFLGKKGIVEVNLGDPGHCAEENIFNTRLRGGSHGHGVSVATETSCDPEDVDFLYGGRR